jgi:hypothetical protein
LDVRARDARVPLPVAGRAHRLRGRPAAVRRRDAPLGEAPERILHATIDLAGDWTTWRETAPVEVLRPARPWEGADLPVEPSRRGSVDVPVNQLRDPAVYEEEGRVYLLYSVAGERGIALARVELEG